MKINKYSGCGVNKKLFIILLVLLSCFNIVSAAGSVSDTLQEGESKTYNLDGIEYNVKVDTITDTAPYTVRFTVNSEVTNALQEGKTYTLSSNAEITVINILPNEAGDVTGDVVEFTLTVLPGIYLTGDFTDYGFDNDGDGLYDYLVVGVGVDVKRAGNYEVYGFDTANYGIYSYGDIYSDGIQTVQLNFKGTDFSARKMNGPYEFIIRLYSGSVLLNESEYTTSTAYSYNNFEDWAPEGALPNPNVISPIKGSTITSDSVWLNVTTYANAICEYSICRGAEWDGGGEMGCSTPNNMTINPPVESKITGTDYFRISASGDELNILESFNDVKSAIGKNDLDALKSGTITNDKGTYEYDQYLMQGNSSVQFAVSDESGVIEDPQLYLKTTQDDDTNTIEDGSEVFRYKLTFPTALKSDIDSNRDLDDLDNEKISILGTEYTIINTDFSTDGVIALELMGGAVRDTIEKDETKTYAINNKEYEVTLIMISNIAPYQAKFVINDETTDALAYSETYMLDDGLVIGVREVMPVGAGNATGGLVDFYIGAKNLKLEDSNSSSGNGDGKLIIGSNDITDAQVDIVWSNSTSELSLSTIQIAWQSSDNYYAPIGGKLSEHISGDQDALDLISALNIDFEFAGIEQSASDIVEIAPSGSLNLKLKMKNKAGEQINEEIFYFNGSDILLAKDSNRQIYVNENDVAGDEDFFIVETNKYSHLMQIKKFSSADSEITLKDVDTGNTETVNVSEGIAKFYKDGYEYMLEIVETGEYSNWESATLTEIAGDIGDTKADLWTQHEHKIELDNSDGWTIKIWEAPGVRRDEIMTAKDVILINASIVAGKITPGMIRTTSPTYNNPSEELKDPTIMLESNNNMRKGMTQWGTLIEQNVAGDQDSIKITLPEKEAVANVYIGADYSTKEYGVSHSSLISNLEETEKNEWYEARVACSDEHGNQDETTSRFYVEKNEPPVIWKTSINPKPMRVGDTATFGVFASDPDNNNLTFKWYVDGAETESYPAEEEPAEEVEEGTEEEIVVEEDGEEEIAEVKVPPEEEVKKIVITKVLVNDIDVTDIDDLMLDVERNSNMEIKVYLSAKEDKEIDIEAVVGGGESDNIIGVTSDVFAVKEGVNYEKLLNLFVPPDFDEGNYGLRISINDREDLITTKNINLHISAKRHDLQVYDIIFSPENEVKAGRALLTTVILNNYGEKDEETAKVKISIPELGISASTYVYDMMSGEIASSEELYMRIPECTEPDGYEVKVEVSVDKELVDVGYAKIEIIEGDVSCPEPEIPPIRPIIVTNGHFVYYANETGEHEIKVVVSDGEFEAEHIWNISVGESIESEMRAELENLLSYNSFNSVENANMCVIIKEDKDYLYHSFDIVILNGVKQVSVSENRYCDGFENEDFVFSFINHKSFSEQKQNLTLGSLRENGGGKRFYILPSKFVKEGFSLSVNEEFEERYCPIIKENLDIFSMKLYGFSGCIARAFDGDTTDFLSLNESELANLSNVVLEKRAHGKINFGGNVLDLRNIVNMDSHIVISNGIVAIDTANLPVLNSSATVAIYNLPYESAPAIDYNEGFTTNPADFRVQCPADVCSNINYNPSTGTLTFDAAHFSSFRVENKLRISNIEASVNGKKEGFTKENN